MFLSIVTPVVFATTARGAGVPSQCGAGVCVQEVEAQSLLQGALMGSDLRAAEDDDSTSADAPTAALLQTSSRTSSGSGQRALLPLGFFDEDAPQYAPQSHFVRELSAQGVPNDVGFDPLPLFPGSFAPQANFESALVQQASPAVEKSRPLALSQAPKPISNPHSFFDEDDGDLFASQPKSVSLVDAGAVDHLTENQAEVASQPKSVSLVDAGFVDHLTEKEAEDKAFAAAVRERTAKDDAILEAKKHEEALAELQMQKQLEEQADEMANALAQQEQARSTPSASGRVDVPVRAPMRQPSSSSLENLAAAQHNAAMRLSGVAPDMPPQHEQVGLQRTEVQLLHDDRLALDEKLRGLELAQWRQQQPQPQQPQSNPNPQPDQWEGVALAERPSESDLADAALQGAIQGCQPGGPGWPACASTQAYGPEHGSCTPQCTWQCDTPRCDEVCEPQCQPPRCETRCAAAETASCVMECDEPHCAVTCNRNQCPSQDCPSCISTCSEPMCKLRCPSAQPCRNVCEVPSCEWHCHAPEVCPQPTCHMVCEAPRGCQGNTYQQLPPLSPGELSVRSFVAPPGQSGGSHVEGSVQHYDVHAAQGYVESPMQWPVQGYAPSPQSQVPNWSNDGQSAQASATVAAPSPQAAVPNRIASETPQQEPDSVQPRHQTIGQPEQPAEIRYADGHTQNLVLPAMQGGFQYFGPNGRTGR